MKLPTSNVLAHRALSHSKPKSLSQTSPSFFRPLSLFAIFGRIYLVTPYVIYFQGSRQAHKLVSLIRAQVAARMVVSGLRSACIVVTATATNNIPPPSTQLHSSSFLSSCFHRLANQCIFFSSSFSISFSSSFALQIRKRLFLFPASCPND